MKERNIVFIGIQYWDFEIGSNARNIAIEFAKHYRVLYVNTPLDWITKQRRKGDKRISKYLAAVEKKDVQLEHVQENIWSFYPDFVAASINWIPFPFLYDFLNRRTNRKFAASIKKGVAKLGFDSYVLFNDSLMFKGFYMKEFLRPQKFIYYIRDYLIIQPYFKKHGVRLEAKLIAQADVVVANSTYLRDYAANYNSRAFYVGQGCEVEMFDERTAGNEPEDIRQIPKPRIGYVGFLMAMRLDINLIQQMAAKRPDWSIVLVGPEDETFAQSSLHQQPNVYFIGKKRPDELPAYMKYFDVCMNPQAVNPLTIGNYPRKVDEYLAMGKPVVATKTRAMEVFSEHTSLADSPEEFIIMVERSLKLNTFELAQKRKEFARSHTWPNSVKAIYEAMESIG